MLPGMERVVELDEHRLNALTHPVRRALLLLLRTDGPATATRLAQRVGESSGLTSYHLRKLAEVGLVAEDHERGTKRERWWYSPHDVTTWSPSDFLGNPETHRASVALRREIHRWQLRLLDQWLDEESEWDKAWVDAAGLADALLTLTPESARALSEELHAVVRRYRDNPPAEGTTNATRVVWLQHLVPIRGELPL